MYEGTRFMRDDGGFRWWLPRPIAFSPRPPLTYPLRGALLRGKTRGYLGSSLALPPAANL